MIVGYPQTKPLTSEEKDLVWKFRFYLSSQKKVSHIILFFCSHNYMSHLFGFWPWLLSQASDVHYLVLNAVVRSWCFFIWLYLGQKRMIYCTYGIYVLCMCILYVAVFVLNK